MTLVKWNPDFPSVSSWFDDFLNDREFTPRLLKRTDVMPAVNITETEDQYKLEVAAPGMEKSDFKLEVKEGYLTIKGEHKSEQEKKEEKFTRKEFQYSSFVRSFAMPDNVRITDVKAFYNNGILTVVLPKKEVTPEEHGQEIAVH